MKVGWHYTGSVGPVGVLLLFSMPRTLQPCMHD